MSLASTFTFRPRPRTILFDFMGTCLDWHSSVVSAMPISIPAGIRSALALHWRQAYFDANTARLAQGLPPEDIDITHRRVLESILSANTTSKSNSEPSFAEYRSHFASSTVMDRCIQSWHQQRAWPDVLPALQSLCERGYELVVHANGTTRLQLDNLRSSGLREGGVFSLAFSSQMLGVYKPAPKAYIQALDLLDRKPEECVMVAAHASDTKGAKACGIRSIYVYRWSDDIHEDQEVVRAENDAWIEGMGGLLEALEKMCS